MALTFSQLMHEVNVNNHKNLWKSAYHKFSGARNLYQQHLDAQRTSSNDISNAKLVSYDTALREVILRAYKCRIVQKLGCIEVGCDTNAPDTNGEDGHSNLCPAVVAIETNNFFFTVHDVCIEHTLLDCITFSPALLDNYNKSLFLIYQLLNLLKSFHEKGLLVGEINICDIHMSENSWLQVFPNLEANLIELPNDFLKPFPTLGGLPKELNGSYRIDEYAEMWVNGFLSNFDYLMILNKLAGRTMESHANHAVMPWVRALLVVIG